jgi:hypothetical protein
MKGLLLSAEPRPMRSYIFRMALLSLVPSLLVGSLVVLSGLFSEVGPQFKKEGLGPPIPAAATIFFLLVIFCPVVETLLMALGIAVMGLFTRKKVMLAMLSAVVWGLLHSLASPGWGLIVCWPFFVFSCAFLAWRPKSWLKALWAAACIHALQNLLPGLVLAIDILFGTKG